MYTISDLRLFTTAEVYLLSLKVLFDVNRLFGNATSASIEDQIKLWLRQSCDSGGSRWEREENEKS